MVAGLGRQSKGPVLIITSRARPPITSLPSISQETSLLVLHHWHICHHHHQPRRTPTSSLSPTPSPRSLPLVARRAPTSLSLDWPSLDRGPCFIRGRLPLHLTERPFLLFLFSPPASPFSSSSLLPIGSAVARSCFAGDLLHLGGYRLCFDHVRDRSLCPFRHSFACVCLPRLLI